MYHIGWVVAIPQAKPVDNPHNYGTPEWITEIFFTEKLEDLADAKGWAQDHIARSKQPPGATGCGHNGKSLVTKLIKKGAEFSEEKLITDPNAKNMWYSLVPAGTYTDPVAETGLFIASEIWIAEKADDWVHMRVFHEATMRGYKLKP